MAVKSRGDFHPTDGEQVSLRACLAEAQRGGRSEASPLRRVERGELERLVWQQHQYDIELFYYLYF